MERHKCDENEMETLQDVYVKFQTHTFNGLASDGCNIFNKAASDMERILIIAQNCAALLKIHPLHIATLV